MPCSAVTQPSCRPFRNGGTRGSTEAVHSTRVSPNSASTAPSAWRVYSGTKRTTRISSALRLLGRFMTAAPSAEPPQGRGARVVAVRAVAGHGPLGERPQSAVHGRVLAERGDVVVLHARPQAVRADHQ